MTDTRQACLHVFYNPEKAAKDQVEMNDYLTSLYNDIVEKGFGNLKNRLKFRRMGVSSELSLNGKLFVEFVALIYLSYVKKKMQSARITR